MQTRPPANRRIDGCCIDFDERRRRTAFDRFTRFWQGAAIGTRPIGRIDKSGPARQAGTG